MFAGMHDSFHELVHVACSCEFDELLKAKFELEVALDGLSAF